MFKNKAFAARLLRLLGALLVASAGYFVYLDNELQYTDAAIIQYDKDHPVVHFIASPTEQITYKFQESFDSAAHPIGSELLVRYPKSDYGKLEYVSPLKQWAFYIVLFAGLIVFFIGAVFTIKVRKEQALSRNNQNKK